ncbi:FtsK/SpoIIIE domain-containing protein [Verrucosispora sp. WMMA2121]|uniref:FtsK/SpoIIIE domain-containing protein n=1 Tax=Verrucosispora sp. WMMA2121 TaxID=3015164 RepID=UPI0022B63B80|nr:FtsK/SpoIIIE domain-containing protein [Verrucosispora sp. WMMA2121]MCZ7419456.1 FtsK/SpoIIIE domain-containing protein [Verrucosispora sp. WMMA2121]
MDTVGGPKARTLRAAALHRRAAATVAAATTILDETRPVPADQRRQYALAERLRDAASILAPGWAGAALDAVAPGHPAGEGPPPFVRVGTAAPLDDARFPALVPMFGSGHLATDTDAHDPRVAGLLRAVLLRLLAATPAGALLVRAVDATGVALAPFAALGDAGVLAPPATDVDGLRAVLAEAERWVAPDASGPRRHDRSLLLVLAALPEAHLPGDLARIEALAEQGPAAGLHLVVAGWPAAGRPALPRATPLAMRTAYALLGNPPGAAFAGTDGGLNSPVFVDPDPPTGLVDTVCRRIAAQVEAGSRLALSHLLPPTDELGQAAGTDGLTTTVGDAGGRPVSLGFTELTPHWLVSGRSRGCRSTFLTTALLGLVARYGPGELSLYLVDLGAGESFAEFLQTERDRSWIPQVRAAAMAADREYVLDLLDQLTAEVQRRAEASTRAGGQRFAELRKHRPLPRVVCVLENLQVLLTERDRLSAEVAARLDALARTGRAYGVHLVLAGEGDLGLGTRSDGGQRDSLPGQFPVRVALPGGGAVLAPTNDAAAGLPVGSAVVNTAGGLGGPRGAIRGHERMVRFPDPADEPEAVTGLRHRLWSARPPNATPPVVFAGYARPLLTNDPRYRAAVAGQSTAPAALLGRVVDVARSTATVSFGPAAGRNLAVLGPRPAACRLLATAAHTTAAHHPAGTARFVVAVADAEAAQLADTLVTELAERHQVDRVDLAGLVAVADAGEPAYLVVFGLDVAPAEQLPPARLRALLRDGPPAGQHLLGWWRTVPSFATLVEPDETVDKLTAVAVAGVPGAQLTPVFGRPVEWRPRPDRVVLWDGPTERGVVLVPYEAPGSVQGEPG